MSQNEYSLWHIYLKRYRGHPTNINLEWPSLTMASQVPREDLLTLIDCVNAATKVVDTPGVHVASNSRRNLLLECKRRIAALEDPDAEVWPRAFQVNVAVSIDIAATLGVWEKLRGEKSITLSELVKDTGADAAATGQLPISTTS